MGILGWNLVDATIHARRPVGAVASVHLQPRRREGARRRKPMVDIDILGAHSKLQRSVLVRMEGGRDMDRRLAVEGLLQLCEG